jgi:hypothetical protein
MKYRTSSNLLVRLFVMIGIALGYVYISYYHYKGFLAVNLFVLATITAITSAFALLILLRPAGYEMMLPKIAPGGIIYMVPYIALLSFILEVWFHGRLGILSTIVFISILIMLLVLRPDLHTALTGVLLLVTVIGVLYSVYTPSFGNDTWRDAIMATQIIERSVLRDLTIVHEAYPFPLVSLLYAVYSMVVGLNTLWSSSVMGILYLMLITLWVYVLAKRTAGVYPHIAVLLALTTPLIVVWSVQFIPQVYSLLMMLPLVFLELHPVILVILATALVMGHGGLALWTLTVLLILAFSRRVFNVKALTFGSLEIKLAIVLMFFALYTMYTALSMVLKGAVINVFEALLAFLGGERVTLVAVTVQRPTLVLGVISLAVLTTLGLVLIIEGKNIMTRLLPLTSLIGLGVSFMGAGAYPDLDLPRYIGLASAVVLTILSPQAVRELAKRGHIGAYYALSLLLLAVISFGLAGTLMPGNPYTANPHSTLSISGLITYSEAQELKNIAFKLCCNNYLVDWRSGRYLNYKYLWIQPLFQGFYNPETQGYFTYAGSYGLLVSPKYLTNFNGVLIFRQSSLDMLEAYSPETDTFLKNIVDKISALYMSPQIRIILFR